MKTGAAALIPTLEGSIFTDNAWSTLGLGWLGACIVLSGSPVAASALTLLDGGAIDREQAFTMLTGSRLGAAFVVLVVGVVYALRRSDGGSRRAPISIGILSLLMTMATYVPGAIVGYLLLDRGAFDDLDIGTSPSLTSATDTLFGWAVDAADDGPARLGAVPVGVVVLLVGFAMFDRVLPAVSEHRLEERGDAWYDAQVADVPRRLRGVPADAVGVGGAHRARPARRQGPPATGEHAAVHRRARTSRRSPTRWWPRSCSATRTRCASSSR